MAEITMKIGNLTSTKTATDADAQAVLLLYYSSIAELTEGLPANQTNQQKLDIVVADIVATIVKRARQQRKQELKRQYESELSPDIAAIKF